MKTFILLLAALTCANATPNSGAAAVTTDIGIEKNLNQEYTGAHERLFADNDEGDNDSEGADNDDGKGKGNDESNDMKDDEDDHTPLNQ